MGCLFTDKNIELQSLQGLVGYAGISGLGWHARAWVLSLRGGEGQLCLDCTWTIMQYASSHWLTAMRRLPAGSSTYHKHSCR
jgi:hypothetical protein